MYSSQSSNRISDFLFTVHIFQSILCRGCRFSSPLVINRGAMGRRRRYVQVAGRAGGAATVESNYGFPIFPAPGKA